MTGWILFCILFAAMPIVSFVSYVFGMFAAGWSVSFTKRKRQDRFRIDWHNGQENLTPDIFCDGTDE